MKDRLEPLGDRAFLRRFVSEVDAACWACTVRAARIAGVEEVVLAYDSVAVITTDACTDLNQVEVSLNSVLDRGISVVSRRLIEIPVLYDGVDLKAVAQQLELDQSELISLHAGNTYQVFAIGFLPGFPYLGYLAPRIAGLGRLATPRASVARGSVAIVGRQTGIYPDESPGGWHLIGRTPLAIVDVERDHFPISAGDRVQFIPMGIDEYHARLGESL